jgi:hypothetical protein
MSLPARRTTLSLTSVSANTIYERDLVDCSLFGHWGLAPVLQLDYAAVAFGFPFRGTPSRGFEPLTTQSVAECSNPLS